MSVLGHLPLLLLKASPQRSIIFVVQKLSKSNLIGVVWVRLKLWLMTISSPNHDHHHHHFFAHFFCRHHHHPHHHHHHHKTRGDLPKSAITCFHQSRVRAKNGANRKKKNKDHRKMHHRQSLLLQSASVWVFWSFQLCRS